MSRLTTTLLMFTLLLFAMASGCGSDTSQATPSPSDGLLSDPTPDLAGIAVEELVAVPDSDMYVAYTGSSDKSSVTPDYISMQWESMKACLGIIVASPVIVVEGGWLASVTADDILLSFDGRLLASSTFVENKVDIVRISSFDFDGSQGNPGFHLRSIVGRYIWTLSGFPIRDYNTNCASAN